MYARRCFPVLLLAVAGCSSAIIEEPVQDGTLTTLPRFFEGDRVTLEELAASRQLAVSCAQALARVDRELREPWIEARDARFLLGQLRGRAPVEFELAETAWLGAEPCSGGPDREAFGEIGLYRPHRKQGESWLRANPDSLEGHVANLLRSAREDTARGRLLSGWRRLAPAVTSRGAAYLSSVWEFSIGAESRVELRDSLLGPFTRCAAYASDEVGASGPLADAGGFEMPAALLHELQPGPGLALGSLLRGLCGDGPPSGFVLADGPLARNGEPVLVSLLPALTDGMCGIEYVPAGAASVRVTVSYLVGRCDARAEITLRRAGFSTWTLGRLTVEPPAEKPHAGRRGQALDLMPLLRARRGT